jgi:hypothetical protein
MCLLRWIQSVVDYEEVNEGGKTYRVRHIATSLELITGVSSRLGSCSRISNPFRTAQNSAVECQDSASLNELFYYIRFSFRDQPD